MDVNTTLNTSGDGFWSTEQKPVKITKIVCIADDEEYEDFDDDDEDEQWGEVRVFFDTSTWDINTDGLIYTDDGFLAELNKFLATKHLPAIEGYSEQGMQGSNFVSLDVEGDFIKAWELAGETVAA